jgi:hypothetical protein
MFLSGYRGGATRTRNAGRPLCAGGDRTSATRRRKSVGSAGQRLQGWHTTKGTGPSRSSWTHGYDNVDLFTVVLNLFTCNHVCVFLAEGISWWGGDQRGGGVRPFSQGQSEGPGQQVEPGGRAGRVHQRERAAQARRVQRCVSPEPSGRRQGPLQGAPRHGDRDEVGRREAARLLLDGQQRHQPVHYSHAEGDSKGRVQ